MDYRVGWNGMGVYILAKMGKKCTEEIENCYTEYGPGTQTCGKNGMPQKCLSLCLVRVGWGCIFGLSVKDGQIATYIHEHTNYSLFFVAPFNLPELWGRETGSGLVEVGGVLHGLVRFVPLRGVRYAVPPVYCRL